MAFISRYLRGSIGKYPGSTREKRTHPLLNKEGRNSKDKSKCSYYKKLVERGIIDEKDNPP
jgi:hypothetical protein